MLDAAGGVPEALGAAYDVRQAQVLQAPDFVAPYVVAPDFVARYVVGP